MGLARGYGVYHGAAERPTERGRKYGGNAIPAVVPYLDVGAVAPHVAVDVAAGVRIIYLEVTLKQLLGVVIIHVGHAFHLLLLRKLEPVLKVVTLHHHGIQPRHVSHARRRRGEHFVGDGRSAARRQGGHEQQRQYDSPERGGRKLPIIHRVFHFSVNIRLSLVFLLGISKETSTVRRVLKSLFPYKYTIKIGKIGTNFHTGLTDLSIFHTSENQTVTLSTATARAARLRLRARDRREVAP